MSTLTTVATTSETSAGSVTTATTSRRGFLGLIGTTALLAGCGTGTTTGDGPGKAQVTKLKYQGNAGSVALPELAADLGYLGTVTLDWVGNTTSGPQDIQSATTGQTHFGSAFNGAVVKLFAAGAPITAVIGSYGVDAKSYDGYYTLSDSPLATAADLYGRKVGMNTLGAHFEAVLDTFLQRNGADRKKVEPIVVAPINIDEALRQRQIDVGVLSGILRDEAVAGGGIKALFTDYQLLGSFTAGTYVFRNDFIKQNPDTMRAFTSGVAKAIEWARTTPQPEVIDRMTKIVAARGRSEPTTSLKYFKSFGIAGTGGVIAEKEISTWISWLEDQGQVKKGKVTASSVYTNQYNSFAKGGS